MRIIISLKKPVRVVDEQGNDYTVNQIGGDVLIGGGQINLQPTQHQMRDGINRKANQMVKDGHHREMFMLSQQEIAADEELAVLLEQVKARVTALYQAKLEAI